MRRVLFVSRSRYALPLPATLAPKWDALSARMDVSVLAPGTTGGVHDRRFLLTPTFPVRVLDGPVFWLALPFRIARALRDRDVHVIVAQSPFEGLAALLGRRLARRRPALVVELHGDWRTFARLYGSSPRAMLGPLLDRLAVVALRRADAVRPVSATLAADAATAGAKVAETFTTFTDLTAFDGPVEPLPEAPGLLAVGVLQRYKNVDGIVTAWRLAAPSIPGATLTLVGRGPLQHLVDELERDNPDTVSLHDSMPQRELARALDASWGLLLPSRSEGLPRVAIESFCRGRPVIGGRAGGIPDIVVDDATGLLVDPERPEEIAAAIVRLLGDRSLAERLAGAAARDADRWRQTAEQFAERMERLVESVLP